ncbi:MAG TPA: hypothetical protein VHG92_11775 [Afifellaceae bacterium]|nr:hypothetical protein [Afifellaceae bacterium]
MHDFVRRSLAGIAAAALVALAVDSAAWAQSGLITRAERLPPITLGSGKPLAEAPYELEAGKYYRLEIEADGTAELAIGGPEFFRNVWVNEIVIEDIEIRPMGGIDSIEFDAAGTATITFIPIRPGRFELRIPGTTGETQAAIFNVGG